MVDLKVNLAGLWLDNPIIPASGCFGYGEEFKDFYDINILGSFSFKGTTKEPREGNKTPRIAECDSGMLNAVGLQNPGIDYVAETILPKIKGYFNKPVVANIGGFSVEEFCHCAKIMDSIDNVGIIEVNISCPNLHCGGVNFGSSEAAAAEVTAAVRSVVKNKPLFIKLSPNVTDIKSIAAACEGAGADGISLINTLVGMRIDIKTGRPVLANVTGGVSGNAIYPVALRAVYDVANTVKIPVMGIGGVDSAEKVIEMMMAGASAVQVGAANLRDPFICKKIIENLPVAAEKIGISSLSEIIRKSVV